MALSLAAPLLAAASALVGVCPARAPLRLARPALCASDDPAPPGFDMSLLSERIERIRAEEAGEEAEVALLLIDAMLPRQRLQAQFEPPLVDLLRSLLGEPVVICGMERGLRMPRPMRVGVTARVELSNPLESEGDRTVSFIGGRMCEILSLIDRDATFGLGVPVFTARVRWLNMRRRGSEPEAFRSDDEAGKLRIHERAEALLKRKDEWMSLVSQSGRERCEGQLDQILLDLGDPPDPTTHPSDVALWVAALINPIPALGVALEIRPAVLCACDADERIDAVERALDDSIARLAQRMDGGPLFDNYW